MHVNCPLFPLTMIWNALQVRPRGVYLIQICPLSVFTMSKVVTALNLYFAPVIVGAFSTMLLGRNFASATPTRV